MPSGLKNVADLAATIHPQLSSTYRADLNKQLAGVRPPPIQAPVTAKVDDKGIVGTARTMGRTFIQSFAIEATARLNQVGVAKELSSPAQVKAASNSGAKLGSGFKAGFKDGFKDGFSDGIRQAMAAGNPAQIKAASSAGVKTGGAFSDGFNNGFKSGYKDGIRDAVNNPAQTKAAGDAGNRAGRSFGTGFNTTVGNILKSIGIVSLFSKAQQAASSFFQGIIDEGKEAVVVGRQTDAALKSTGNAAGRSREQIEAMSMALSKQLGIDDEAIQANANVLLSYRKISGEIFDNALPAVSDLAAKMRVDGSAAAKMLGKALNDPIGGTGALAKAGIKLTEAQKEQIKSYIKLGETQKAQNIILGEVRKAVGGQAAASVTAAEKQKVAWANFKEELANKLYPAMEKVRNFIITKVIPALSGLWSGLTGGKEKLAGVAAQFQDFGRKIIGFVNEWKPKIQAFLQPGVEAVRKFISYVYGNKDARTLIGVLALAGAAFIAFNVIVSANPISLVILAVAGLVVGLSKLYRSSEGFRQFWDTVVYPIFKLWVFYITNVLIPTLLKLWKDILLPAFKAMGEAVRLAWNAWIHPALSAFITVSVAVGRAVNGLWVNYVRPAWDSIREHISAAWVFLRDKIFGPMKNFVTVTLPSAFQSGVDAIGRIWNTIKQAAAKPVLFVMETVYQNGIRKGWQAIIAKVPGVPDLPDISPSIAVLKLAGLATGGQPYIPATTGKLRGPGTPTSDSFPIMASDQEYMLRAHAANRIDQKYGRDFLDYMNQYGDIPPSHVAQYKDGGRLGDLARSIVAGSSNIEAVQKLYYNKGGKGGVTSSFRFGDPGFHGQGLAVDFGGYHQDDVASRLMTVGSRILEMIHSSNGKHYGIKRGNMYDFGSQLWAEHENHVHLAAYKNDVAEILAGNAGPAGPASGGGFFGIVEILKRKVFGPLFDTLVKPFRNKPGGDGIFNQTATGINNFAIDGIKKGVDKVLGDQKMIDPNGGGGPGPAGSIPTYFTYFGGSSDASTWGRTMANGEPPNRPAFSSSYWPLGTVATVTIGGKSEQLVQKDLGPNKFVYDNHPGINVIDLTEAAMRHFINPPNNTRGHIKVNQWGTGRTLYGFRAKGYDQGGILEHGDLGLNLSGKPETVLTHDESRGLKAMTRDLPTSDTTTVRSGNSTLVLKVLLDGEVINDRVELVLEEHDAELIRELA